MTSRQVLSVECPRCKRKPRQKCIDALGNSRRSHRERVQKALVDVPAHIVKHYIYCGRRR